MCVCVCIHTHIHTHTHTHIYILLELARVVEEARVHVSPALVLGLRDQPRHQLGVPARLRIHTHDLNWPLHDIAITNIVCVYGYGYGIKTGSVGGGVYRAMGVQ